MKSYAMLALGFTFCITASAASGNVVSVMTPYQTAQAVSEMTIDNSQIVMKAEANKVASKLTSIDDIVGDYEWTFNNAFDDDEFGGMQLCNLSISLSDEKNTVLISGYKGLTWTATVDVAASTMTIKKQFAFTAEDGADVYLTPFRWDVDDKGNATSFSEIDALVGTYEDGVISFNRIDLIGLPNPSKKDSFYGPLLGYENIMTNIPVAEIDMNEWNIIGDAEYSDGWIAPLYYEKPGEVFYSVKVAQNKKDYNKVLLIDPYGANSPFAGVNLNKTAPGYIEMDKANPDVVVCTPRLYSGYTDNKNGNYYNYNTEGYLYYLNGLSFDTILERLIANDAESSWYDPTTKTIYIYNCIFGTESDKTGTYTWIDGNQQPVVMESVIKLPSNWDDSGAGVEGITVDENAPVKYFNLQGVEVANPEAGQLVIKKQGSKAEKMIVR